MGKRRHTRQTRRLLIKAHAQDFDNLCAFSTLSPVSGISRRGADSPSASFACQRRGDGRSPPRIQPCRSPWNDPTIKSSASLCPCTQEKPVTLQCTSELQRLVGQQQRLVHNKHLEFNAFFYEVQRLVAPAKLESCGAHSKNLATVDCEFVLQVAFQGQPDFPMLCSCLRKFVKEHDPLNSAELFVVEESRFKTQHLKASFGRCRVKVMSADPTGLITASINELNRMRREIILLKSNMTPLVIFLKLLMRSRGIAMHSDCIEMLVICYLLDRSAWPETSLKKTMAIGQRLHEMLCFYAWTFDPRRHRVCSVHGRIFFDLRCSEMAKHDLCIVCSNYGVCLPPSAWYETIRPLFTEVAKDLEVIIKSLQRSTDTEKLAESVVNILTLNETEPVPYQRDGDTNGLDRQA